MPQHTAKPDLGSASLPVNPHRVNSCLSKSFPMLFLDGKGDTSRLGRIIPVSLGEGVKHLLQVAFMKDGLYYYPFAQRKSLIFYVLDLIERKRVKDNTSAFFRHGTEMSNLSLEIFRAKLVDPIASKNYCKKLAFGLVMFEDQYHIGTIQQVYYKI